MGPDSTETREISVMDRTATSIEVSDLKPYTTFTFSISAMTKAGTGPAMIVSSTTPEGGKVWCLIGVHEMHSRVHPN